MKASLSHEHFRNAFQYLSSAQPSFRLLTPIYFSIVVLVLAYLFVVLGWTGNGELTIRPSFYEDPTVTLINSSPLYFAYAVLSSITVTCLSFLALPRGRKWIPALVLACGSGLALFSLIVRIQLDAKIGFPTLIFFFLASLYLIAFDQGKKKTDQKEVEYAYDLFNRNAGNNQATIFLGCKARADSLALTNIFLLFFIIMIIVGVGIFIPFAGKIAGEDNTSVNAYGLAESTVSKLRERRDSLVAEESEFIQSQFDEKSRNYSMNDAERTAYMAAFEAKKNALEKDIDNAIKILPTSFDELSKSVAQQSQTTVLVSANVTRFGIVAISLYLVQILVNLYRFNALMSGFYRAIMDAIVLNGTNELPLKDSVELMIPKVGFGKEAQTLPDSVIEKFSIALKDVLNTVKKD